MKDARGHGSNGRGGSGMKTFVMPSKPYRQSDENTAHQRAIADQHGVETDHLRPFPITLIGDPGHAEAQRATIGRLLKGFAGNALRAGAKLHANSLNGYDPRNKRG